MKLSLLLPLAALLFGVLTVDPPIYNNSFHISFD